MYKVITEDSGDSEGNGGNRTIENPIVLSTGWISIHY